MVTLDDLHLQDHLNISVLITHTEWKSVHFQGLDRMQIYVEIIENERTVHCPGQAGVNQLGGVFVNGRPLPDYVRWVRQIFFICRLFGMFLIFVITV